MTNLNWTETKFGFTAATDAFTYYIGEFHGDIHVDYRDNTVPARKVRGREQFDLTHLKWGCTSFDAAKAIAQDHATQNV